jgi:hypothetical protein
MSMISTLSQPFNHRAVIEGPLLSAFPDVWRGTYYFDPARNRSGEQEASVLFSRIRKFFNVEGRPLQNFVNQVAGIVREGRETVVPLGGRVCYLMTENFAETERNERLSEFFGKDVLKHPDLGLTTRLYEEFMTRHGLAHTIEFLEPHLSLRQKGILHSERFADAYGLLSMFKSHGEIIFHFAELVAQGRNFQKCDRYNTATAVKGIAAFVTDNGIKHVKNMSDHDVFITAWTVSQNARTNRKITMPYLRNA